MLRPCSLGSVETRLFLNMWIWITVTAIWTKTTAASVVLNKGITEAQYLKFPKLFHLDDYQGCLVEKKGIYCLGTFDVTIAPEPTYTAMKLYSEDGMNFNRTRLHRGYCLNIRCASFNGTSTERFQSCVARWGLRRGLTLQLRTLEYCHNKQDSRPKQEDIRLDLFLMVIGVVLVANVLGTLYDLCGGKKETFLSWSVGSNWLRLFSPHADDDSSLVPPGVQVLLTWLVIINHVGTVHTTLYLQNPRTVEQFSHNFLVMSLRSSAGQIAIIMSSFIFAKDLLKKKKPRFRLLPKLLLRRIFKIFPVHLLSLIYITQRWSGMGDTRGLQWHLVETKAQNCADNFWYTAFFAENLVDGSCLEHTLYLSLAVQLYILSCVVLMPLMLMHSSRPLTALVVLATLLAGSCAVTAGAAVSYDWTPMMMMTGSENFRSSFANEHTFHQWYSKPWGYVTSWLGGLFLPLLLRDMKENRIKLSQYRWVTVTTVASVASVLVAVYVGGAGAGEGAGRAVHLALEGLVASVLIVSVILMLTLWIPGFLSWWMWNPLSRLSIPLVTLYDVGALTITASRPVLHHVAITSWIVDVTASASYAYLVGIPVVVLLGLPLERTWTHFLE